MVAEKLSTKVLKNWIMLWKKARARSVAKIRPITASGPLLTHRLLLKANLPARMEIIRYLLIFTGIYQKRFLVVKTPFWTEPRREELRYSELPAANGRDWAFTLLNPKQGFGGAGERGNLPFSGRRGKGLFFFFTYTISNAQTLVLCWAKTTTQGLLENADVIPPPAQAVDACLSLCTAWPVSLRTIMCFPSPNTWQ